MPFWCTLSRSGTAFSPFVTSTPGEADILWVVQGSTLYAYNAVTGEPLYNSDVVAADRLGSTQNFLHFTAIAGKVFVGTAAQAVVAYGLR